jgi:magnesium-transporting ATPase (P-type)
MRSALVDRSRPWEGLCSTDGIFGDKIGTMTEERMIPRRVALDLDRCTWH